MERLELEFADADELARVHEQTLRHGIAFVPGLSFAAVGDACELVVVHPDTGDEVVLPARVTAIHDDPPGTGLRLQSTAGLAELVAPAADAADASPRRSSPPERLRTLKLAEQVKLARTGELHDRVALERMFGKNVWEALLQNPRLTVPEVARIARKGTVPRPLLDLIVDSATWVKAGPVRRALLANPRLGADAIVRVLRLTPRRELKLIEKQLGYPAAVREAARKLAES